MDSPMDWVAVSRQGVVSRGWLAWRDAMGSDELAKDWRIRMVTISGAGWGCGMQTPRHDGRMRSRRVKQAHAHSGTTNIRSGWPHNDMMRRQVVTERTKQTVLPFRMAHAWTYQGSFGCLFSFGSLTRLAILCQNTSNMPRGYRSCGVQWPDWAWLVRDPALVPALLFLASYPTGWDHPGYGSNQLFSEL